MKLQKSILLLAVVGLVFAFGAAVGSLFGFNPYVTGAGSSVSSVLSISPQGAIRSGLDLSAVLSDLTAYLKVNSQTIWTQIMKGSDFEQYMKKISGVKGTYRSTVSQRTEFLQAYQKGWQPKGAVTLEPYESTCYPIKMDYTEEDLLKLHKTYLTFLYDERKKPHEQPFVKWLVQYHIIPGITEELRALSVKGSYVAPTPGTAGNSIEAADGIFTQITNQITAGNITPYSTGAITNSTIVDQYEGFHKALPAKYRSMTGLIFISSSRLEDYKYAYRDAYGTNRDYEGPTVKLWGTTKTLVGLDDLTGDRMLFTPTGATGNLICLRDEIMMPTPSLQLDKRDVHILADFHRGWGFENLEEVFTNDVA